MRLDQGTEVCDRCGMLLHTSLVQFHKCNGTNMAARPANVPEGQWNEALMKALGAAQVEPKPKPKPKPREEQSGLGQYYNDLASVSAEDKKKRNPPLWAILVTCATPALVAGLVLLLQRCGSQ